MHAEDKRALVVYAFAAAFAGVLAWFAVTAPPSPWLPVLTLPWAAFMTGIVASVWLRPRLLRARSAPWKRTLADALPGVAIAFALAEATRRVVHVLGTDGAVVRPGTFILDWGLVLLAAAALAIAVRGRPRAAPRVVAVASVVVLALMAFPASRPVAALLLGVLHVAAVLGVAGFRRPVGQWVLAALLAGGALVIGFVAILAAFGSVFPPEVILDDALTMTLFFPLIAFAALTFCATLAFRPRRRVFT